MQWKPNVTVAAIICNHGRYLLVEENVDGHIVLNQPAGHIEEGESLLDAVKREVLEETAWHFQPQALSGIYLYHNQNNGITYLRFCFYGQCNMFENNRILDQGIIRTVWMTTDEIRSESKSLRSPIVLQCIEDHLSGKSCSLDILKNYVNT